MPLSFLTQRWSNTASMVTMPSSSAETGARSASSSTPQVRAASSTLGEMGSQPPKTMSSSSARGANSRMRGLRSLSRSPRRMWAIWLTDPIGAVRPRRAAMTPAMKVEATAPIPGVKTPRRPVAGAMSRGLFMEKKHKHLEMVSTKIQED
ncbi:MAG: hypothetical protein Ct9H300mP12_02910 [Acidimicrobiales bacterium]|nr:MAG: hypothetical protein Ct9H300mP12_02910 [Acidimicrobiales bacterium]